MKSSLLVVLSRKIVKMPCVTVHKTEMHKQHHAAYLHLWRMRKDGDAELPNRELARGATRQRSLDTCGDFASKVS
jgi:hypothetical protein